MLHAFRPDMNGAIGNMNIDSVFLREFAGTQFQGGAGEGFGYWRLEDRSLRTGDRRSNVEDGRVGDWMGIGGSLLGERI